MSQKEMKRAYPDDERSRGRIGSGSKFIVIVSWIFALFWVALSVPASLASVNEAQKGNYFALMILAFPAIGIGFVVRAIRDTIRWRKFGRVVLVLETLPGLIGEKFRAHIEIQGRIESKDGIHLRLGCINRITTGSGRYLSTTDRIRFEEKKTVPDAAIAASASGWQIPVQFDVPANQPQTDTSDPNNQIFWFIEAKAATPGVDFSSKFFIPVFAANEEAKQN